MRYVWVEKEHAVEKCYNLHFHLFLLVKVRWRTKGILHLDNIKVTSRTPVFKFLGLVDCICVNPSFSDPVPPPPWTQVRFRQTWFPLYTYCFFTDLTTLCSMLATFKVHIHDWSGFMTIICSGTLFAREFNWRWRSSRSHVWVIFT